MKKVFLVSLVGEGVHARRSILGFISSNNSGLIATYIKNRYNLILGEQYEARFTFEIGVHWEYASSLVLLLLTECIIVLLLYQKSIL